MELPIKTNLLPWRSRLRKKRIQQGLRVILINSLMVFLLFYLSNMINLHVLSDQENRNQQLQEKIVETKQRISDISSMRIATEQKSVQSNEIYEPKIINFLHDLPTLLPQFFYILRIVGDQNLIILEGKSATQNGINHFLKNLSRRKKIFRSELMSLHKEEKGYEFIIQNTF